MHRGYEATSRRPIDPLPCCALVPHTTSFAFPSTYQYVTIIKSVVKLNRLFDQCQCLLELLNSVSLKSLRFRVFLSSQLHLMTIAFSNLPFALLEGFFNLSSQSSSPEAAFNHSVARCLTSFLLFDLYA